MRSSISSGRRALVAVGCAIVLVAVWWVLEEDGPEQNVGRSAVLEPQTACVPSVSSPGEVPGSSRVASRVEPRAEPSASGTSAGEPSAPSGREVVLFETDAALEPAPPFPLPDVVRVRHGVRLNRERLSDLVEGDIVPIHIPDLGDFQARVERRVVSANGDRAWSGHLEVGGFEHMVVYTQGEQATFATISTPAGTYALEAMGDTGVLFLDERDRLHRPGDDTLPTDE
ncbi:MAG: hypothetical protein RL885_24725 [Planctomycetota bacterium]